MLETVKDISRQSITQIQGRTYINERNYAKLDAFRPRIKNYCKLHNDVLIVACSATHPTPRLSTITWGAESKGIQIPAIESVENLSKSSLDKPCLIFVDGFYLSRRVKNGRIPYYIHSVFGSPLALAGIWNTAKDPDGNIISGCTILTASVEANSKIGYINNEELISPVILSRENEKEWLSLGHSADILKKSNDFDDLVQAYTISPAVNLPKTDAYDLNIISHIIYSDRPVL